MCVFSCKLKANTCKMQSAHTLLHTHTFFLDPPCFVDDMSYLSNFETLGTHWHFLPAFHIATVMCFMHTSTAGLIEFRWKGDANIIIAMSLCSFTCARCISLHCCWQGIPTHDVLNRNSTHDAQHHSRQQQHKQKLDILHIHGCHV